MIDGVSLINQDLGMPVLIATLLLFVGFVWKEWLERHRGKFILNTSITFFSLLALALIILEPTKQTEITDRQAILRTQGFAAGTQDSLLDAHKGIRVLDYDPSKAIGSELDSLTGLFIIGNGVEPFNFWQFEDLPTCYIPNPAPMGLQKVNYDKRIDLGGTLRIKGTFNTPEKNTYLILQDPSGNGLDSVQLSTGKAEAFSLETIPKVTGTFVYQLNEKDSSGVLLKSEPLPVNITGKKIFKVLILNDFPTFETKYLKNFLADQGHKVVVKSQLTKGRYKFEYFNTEKVPIYDITDKVLDEFDLIISDGDTYFGLGKSVKNRLEKQLRENGLGLFLQPTSLLFNVGQRASYFTYQQDYEQEIQLPSSSTTLEKYPYTIITNLRVAPISLNTGKPVAVYKQVGLGRVSTMTVQNSYQLLLEGEEDIYTKFWTAMLDETIKKEDTKIDWEAQTKVPRKDQPFNFNLRTNLDSFQVMDLDSNLVALLQHSQVPSLFSGTVYPKQTGWNQFWVPSDSVSKFPFFVLDSVSWKSVSIFKKIEANRKQFRNESQKNRTVLIDRPISLFIFYLIFLLGMSWLWLAPKLFGD